MQAGAKECVVLSHVFHQYPNHRDFGGGELTGVEVAVSLDS